MNDKWVLKGTPSGLIHRLSVDSTSGSGVLDFSGMDGQKYIYIDILDINENNLLIIKNVGINQIFINIEEEGYSMEFIKNHIVFEEYGTRKYSGGVTWNAHSVCYKYHLIRRGYRPWSPIPEPSTYGAIFGVLGLSLWGWRRRKNKPLAGGTLSLVCAD